MRILTFFDGAQSETTPVIGNVIASNIIKYPDDATYEATEQGAPTTGNLYYNTTINLIRYYNGTSWISIVDEESTQTLQNKTVDGSSTGNNDVRTIASKVEVTPAGNISSSNVEGAINELDTEKQAISEKGVANGYASLDSGGKVPSSQIPPVALSEVNVVADIPARDALTVQEGDTAQTTDTGQWWIYDGSSWLEMVTPAAVTSVNGETGNVSLEADDITDIDTTTVAPSVDDVLTWDGSNWTPQAAGDALENVTIKNVSGTLTLQEEVILANPSAGAFTLTFPTAVGNTGKKYRIKKTTGDFNAVVLDGAGAETIDGDATTSINTIGETITVISDGTGWQILNREIPERWLNYVPLAFDGFGTVSNVQFYYKRTGECIHIKGRFTAGSTGATTAAIALPFSLSVKNAFITNEYNSGALYRGQASGANIAYGIFEDAQVEINFSARGSSNPLVRAGGSSILDTGESASVEVGPIPIEGWNA
jgi:hypothetical protein